MNQAQNERAVHGDGREQILEELRLLLDAMAYRAEDFLHGLLRDGEHDAGHGNGASSTCDWCPVCAAVAVARGERPELTARLAEQLAGLVTLLRQILHEGHSTAAHATPRPADEPVAEDPMFDQHDDDQPPSEPKVQRIEVQRVSGRVLKGDGC